MEVIISVFFLIVFGALIVISFMSKQRFLVNQRLNETPSRSIADVLDDEYVQIKGIIESIGEPLYSPISKRECVYYCVLVKLRLERKTLADIQGIFRLEKSGKFMIKDGSSFAALEAKNITSQMLGNEEYSIGHFNQPSEALEAFLQENGIISKDNFGYNKPLTITEIILQSGETVVAAGKCTWKSASDLGIPETFGSVLYLQRTQKKQLILTNDPKHMRFFSMNAHMRHFPLK